MPAVPFDRYFEEVRSGEDRRLVDAHVTCRSLVPEMRANDDVGFGDLHRTIFDHRDGSVAEFLRWLKDEDHIACDFRR